MRITLLLILFMFGSVCINAQGFPWNDFAERKISEVISATTKAVRPDDTMFLATNILPTRAEVTFTGQSRPVSKEKKAFLGWWGGMLHRDQPEYAGLYETEFLYKDGDTGYWLPTQQPVTKYFAKELKPNDHMVIFLVSAGAYRDAKNIECVLLVEEYQLPQNLKKVVKPPTGNVAG